MRGRSRAASCRSDRSGPLCRLQLELLADASDVGEAAPTSLLVEAELERHLGGREQGELLGPSSGSGGGGGTGAVTGGVVTCGVHAGHPDDGVWQGFPANVAGSGEV